MLQPPVSHAPISPRLQDPLNRNRRREEERCRRRLAAKKRSLLCKDAVSAKRVVRRQFNNLSRKQWAIAVFSAFCVGLLSLGFLLGFLILFMYIVVQAASNGMWSYSKEPNPSHVIFY